MPIFYGSGDIGPISNEDEAIMKGMFLFINILWLLSLIKPAFLIIKDLREGKTTFSYSFTDNMLYERPMFFLLIDWVVVCIWFLIIIFSAGAFFSRFF